MAASSRKGRVGQSQYWTVFGLYFVAVLVLAGAAIYAFATFNFGAAILALLLIGPLGLYFRVVMMRRCRDIGWPAFLPWLLFAIPVAYSMVGGLGSLGSPASVEAMALSAFAVPLLISLIDFGFAIAIGCIRTKGDGEDLAKLFGPGADEAVPATPGGALAGDYSNFDAAVARALEARRGSHGDPGPRIPRGINELDDPAPLPTPTAHARAVAGFGRKVV